MSKRTDWWTLRFRGNHLDIDADNMLHLYGTKKKAEVEAGAFDEDCAPVPVRVRLVYSKKNAPRVTKRRVNKLDELRKQMRSILRQMVIELGRTPKRSKPRRRKRG